MRRQTFAVALLCLAALPAMAQENANDGHYNTAVSGSIQSDMLVPQGKQEDGSHEDFRTNTYADISVLSKFVDAGARFEYLEHPMPGFERDVKGWGLPYVYLKAKLKGAELTVGNFYEQFGSGFILRTYEERTLGIDNSLLGGRLVLKPLKGVQIKGLAGQQRRYWAHNDACIAGADLQLSLDQWIKAMEESGTFLTLGGSWVNKHERKDADADVFVDPTHKLYFPAYVNSCDVRANLQ